MRTFLFLLQIIVLNELTVRTTSSALHIRKRAVPTLPNPEDKAHEPVLGYPSAGAPQWWSKLYLPLDSGGSSKVPMPDGLLIAQSQSLRTAHKAIPWDDAETLQSPDKDNAEDEKVPFKPGTDEEYLEARAQDRPPMSSEESNKVSDAGRPDDEEVTADELTEEKKLESDPDIMEQKELSNNPRAYEG